MLASWRGDSKWPFEGLQILSYIVMTNLRYGLSKWDVDHEKINLMSSAFSVAMMTEMGIMSG